jgi:hypothetical protein
MKNLAVICRFEDTEVVLLKSAAIAMRSNRKFKFGTWNMECGRGQIYLEQSAQ